MPTYQYKAKDGPVKTVEGLLEAESRSEALSQLDARGLIPVWVREKAERASKGLSLLPRRVSFRAVTVFTGQLASLLRAGVPILRAMSTIADQTENARLQTVVRDMERKIRDGNMLSSALADHPALFPALYVNMVHAGESAGRLAELLARLAEAREQEEDTRRSVQAAMAYPLLILSVGFATVFILLAFFLPKVVDLFRDYRDLPLPTRMLIGLSDVFSLYWYWMLLLIVLGGAILKRVAALEKGRAMLDAFKLRVPLLGRFICESDISRFARTLALLIDAGISIDRALALSGNTMRNAALRDEIDRARLETVEQGATLSSGLRRAGHIPPMVTNMAAVGEEAGRLEEAMTDVAVHYEKQCQRSCRLATSLLEPVLILVIGSVVGFIVAAMLLPIFQLGTGL